MKLFIKVIVVFSIAIGALSLSWFLLGITAGFQRGIDLIQTIVIYIWLPLLGIILYLLAVCFLLTASCFLLNRCPLLQEGFVHIPQDLIHIREGVAAAVPRVLLYWFLTLFRK